MGVGWSTPHPGRFTTGKETRYRLYKRGGGWWSPGSVSTNAKNLAPTGIRALDRSARSESLYRLSYNVAQKWLEKYRTEMSSVSKINIKFYPSQNDI